MGITADYCYSTKIVKLTNHDFLSPGWKITIGLLSTSALVALKISNL